MRRKAAIALIGLLASVAFAAAPPARDAWEQAFRNPPRSALPRAWWPWMNGNVTSDGITRDLEWMKRVGIGGVDCIGITLGKPEMGREKTLLFSAPWRANFIHATSLAETLGLEFSINSGPGWSETGGPWVKPAQAMKKLAWSATAIPGGRPFHGFLAPPPATTGPFQDAGYVPFGLEAIPASALPQYYRDAAVVAYRVNEGPPLDGGEVTSSAGPIDAALLADGKLQESLSLSAPQGRAWVQFAYSQPRTVRTAVLGTPAPWSVVIATRLPPKLTATLEAKDESGAFRMIATLVVRGSPEVTVSFPPVTARVFRFSLAYPRNAPPLRSPAPGAVESGLPPSPPFFRLSELRLESEGRVNEFERKAGFVTAEDYDALDTPPAAANAPVPHSDVVDLTARMAPDGSLDWTPPPGRWVVLRLGESLTGQTNHVVAAPEAGLEVDKLDAGAVRDYLRAYLDAYPSRGINALTLDSIESGPQNWTEDIIGQFRHLRGYDPLPWLPALTGVIVGSAAASDKFLWDFRRTIAELVATNHYAEVTKAAHARGLLVYAEALEAGRPQLGDDLEMRRYADIPTGAMWTLYPSTRPPMRDYLADDRGAASVAHLYGQNLAAAESFDGALQPWAFSPRDLKVVADLEFALGINRILIHASPHQPDERAPGVSMGIYGQAFDRHETWAEQAGPWMAYLARSSYLLQQGRFAAEVAYFYGEEAPLVTLQAAGRLDDAPRNYAFDFVNADALRHLFSVRDGDLVTPSGMRYRALQLGGSSRRMTLPVLLKLRDLVRQGATVVGPAPEESPSLADDAALYRQAKAELWGDGGGARRFGRGHVFGQGSVAEALASEGVRPAVAFSPPEADAEILTVHRTAPHAEIFFLNNRRDRRETVEFSFAIAGKAPEAWHAETGQAEPLPFRIEGGRTVVPLDLRPQEALFVVFRAPTSALFRKVPEPEFQVLATAVGPWSVRFPPDLGAPSEAALEPLRSWSEEADPGIKYFSGTATCAKTIEASPQWFGQGGRLILDLGEVHEIAEVALNGHRLGILWTPPFQIDVTDVLRPGANALEIKVTNLWVNRLVGDQQPGAKQYAFTTIPTYRAGAPLRASGLLGPVTISRRTSSIQSGPDGLNSP